MIELLLYICYDRIVTFQNLLKNQAVNLRKKGYSYALIRDRIGVPKSTLSNWLADIPFTPNRVVLERIGNANCKMVQKKQAEKFRVWKVIKTEAEQEIGKISERDLFMLGLGLYLGEGSKSPNSMVRLINANPQVIKLAIAWFQGACRVPKENITITIHLYPDNDIAKTLRFWRKQTGIHSKNFGKTQIDKRTSKSNFKKKKLPYGTAHLHIKTNGSPRLGVRLLRRILAWTENATDQSIQTNHFT